MEMGKATCFFLLQNCPWREVMTKRIALVHLLISPDFFLFFEHLEKT